MNETLPLHLFVHDKTLGMVNGKLTLTARDCWDRNALVQVTKPSEKVTKQSIWKTIVPTNSENIRAEIVDMNNEKITYNVSYTIRNSVQVEISQLTFSPSQRTNDERLTHRMVREEYATYLSTTLPWITKRLRRQNLSFLDEAITNETYLLANDDFIVIEHDSCDTTDLNRLYFVAFVTQKHKDINSVRDLRGRHVELLKEMVNATVKAITDNFEVDVSDLRVFVHYVPSIFRLHVHVCSVEMVKSSVLVGRAIQMEDIINNLSIADDYYKKAILSFSVRSDDELYAMHFQ